MVAYFVPGLFRYAMVLNATWLVNSAAHMWGNRPYDKAINPRENPFVALSAIGKESSLILKLYYRQILVFHCFLSILFFVYVLREVGWLWQNG